MINEEKYFPYPLKLNVYLLYDPATLLLGADPTEMCMYYSIMRVNTTMYKSMNGSHKHNAEQIKPVS